MGTDVSIRPATNADVQRLADIEVEAGQLFHEVGMPEVAGDIPDLDDLRAAINDHRVWVAQVGTEVAGYVIGEVLDGNAHIAQVSMAPTYAGRPSARR